MKRVGCFWARLNPPHKGHMKIIKKILKETDRLIIVIGRSKHKNTRKNPFSGKERAIMLKAYLKEEGINLKKIKIVCLPDQKIIKTTVNNLFRFCPKFDVIYSTDERDKIKDKVARLLRKKAIIKKFKRTGTISSTRIRNAIASGKKWEYLTGKSVAGLLKKFDGIRRIKRAYKLNIAD